VAIEAFREEESLEYIGPDPERLGNNERLGRRENFIARADRCVWRDWEIEGKKEGDEKEGGEGEIYRIFEIPVHSAVSNQTPPFLYGFYLPISLFFSFAPYLSLLWSSPPLLSQFNTFSHLCRCLPLVSARTSILLDNFRFLNSTNT